MFHRITGALLIIVGMSIGAMGLWGLMRTDTMVRVFTEFSEAGALHGEVFNQVLWSDHWRLQNLVIIVIGSSTATAGVAIALKKPLGYLAVFGIFLFAGVYPVLLRTCGYAKYKWESGSVHGALPYFAMALEGLLAYVITQRKRGVALSGQQGANAHSTSKA